MTVLRKNREELKQYYFVIKQLVDREIKRKYARSFLGVIWSVLNPLMTMAVMSMIFSTIFKRTIENYPIYYLTGTIFWQLFSGATNSAMTALVDNRTLLLKVKLPKQTFVLARIYTALTNFGYTCVAYVLMLVVFQIKISPTTPARYITGKSPVAGVSAGAGAAVALGVALLCAVTTSTLAAVSFTLTVESDFWVREVELVGVAVACAAAEDVFSAPQAASSATTTTKKAAQKKRFIEKTPP